MFAVSRSVSASISVSQMTTWLERLAPKSRKPAMLCDDADGRDLREVDLDGPIELELIEQGVGRRGASDSRS